MRDKLGRFSEIEFNLDWVKKQSEVQENGCWHWQGFVNKDDGYGRYRQVHRGKNWLAHRFVFNVVNNYLPKVVMHKCDNRRCVNPEHLMPGTYKMNSRDMMNKGRQSKTLFKERIPQDVRDEIKEQALAGIKTQKQIALEYGIDPSVVSRIKLNKDRNWTRFGG